MASTEQGKGKVASVAVLRPRVEMTKKLELGQDFWVEEIPLTAIEPDPDQPREHFDPEALQELADSLKTEGLLQEPAIYPVKVDEAGTPTRYRILFGERRWRAAGLAQWETIRCKVVPKDADDDLVARLRRIDQQEKENTARAALSAVEEARSIKVKLDTLRKLNPSATAVAVVEQVAQERKASVPVVYKLLGLLDAPASLRAAINRREIKSREVAFELATYWTRLLKEYQAQAKAKREVQFLNKLRDWATARGLDAAESETLRKYADELCIDPKLVKANVKTALQIESGAEDVFDKTVAKAIAANWTVKDARRALSSRGGKGSEEADGPLPLFERATAKGKERFVVYLDRLRDEGVATASARSELVEALRALLTEVEGGAALKSVGTSDS